MSLDTKLKRRKSNWKRLKCSRFKRPRKREKINKMMIFGMKYLNRHPSIKPNREKLNKLRKEKNKQSKIFEVRYKLIWNHKKKV